MRTLFLSSALCLINYWVVAQQGYEITVSQAKKCDMPRRKMPKFHIRETTIEDTFLVKQIQYFIEDEIKKDTLYFGKGYGHVDIFLSRAWRPDMKKVYYINDGFYTLDDQKNDGLFPSQYTMIGGRLVLIYQPVLNGSVFGSCYRYSKRSKRAFKKKLEPFLPKPTVGVFRDVKTGKISWIDRHFRLVPDKLHGGRYIYYFKDDKPPKVMPELPGWLLDPDKPLPDRYKELTNIRQQ